MLFVCIKLVPSDTFKINDEPVVNVLRYPRRISHKLRVAHVARMYLISDPTPSEFVKLHEGFASASLGYSGRQFANNDATPPNRTRRLRLETTSLLGTWLSLFGQDLLSLS